MTEWFNMNTYTYELEKLGIDAAAQEDINNEVDYLVTNKRLAHKYASERDELITEMISGMRYYPGEIVLALENLPGFHPGIYRD